MPVDLTGRLLVAAPGVLEEPTFSRTVILLLEHGAGGATGLVLNRPSVSPVGEAVPGWEQVAAEPRVVFVGGPVSLTTGLCIGVLQPAAAMASSSAWVAVGPGLGVVDLASDPSALRSVAQVRIFSGYAGWSPGQLEHELAVGAWLTADTTPGDCTDPAPEGLWRRVIRRQTPAVAMLASFPADPSVN